MTARDKFEARLEEFGLYEKWHKSGDMAGKIMDDGTVVIFVHYDWETDDPYTELHYPPLDELRKEPYFVKECMDSFFENEDDKFVADLARWLQYGPKCGYGCPLFAEDLYFAASGLETSSKNFEDDDEKALASAAIKSIAEKYGLSVKIDNME